MDYQPHFTEENLKFRARLSILSTVMQIGGDREQDTKPVSLTTDFLCRPSGLRVWPYVKNHPPLLGTDPTRPSHSPVWTSSLEDKDSTLLHASCSPCVHPCFDWESDWRTGPGSSNTSAEVQTPFSLGLTLYQNPDPASAAGTASALEARSWLRVYSGHRPPTSALDDSMGLEQVMG